MNTEQLRELADKLSDGNRSFNIQGLLEQLKGALDGLTNSPADANLHQQVSETISQLTAAISSFEAPLTPAQAETIRAIGGEPYFSQALPAGISALLASNGITPAVVRDHVSQLMQKRAEYLARIEELRRALPAFGLGRDDGIDPVQAGFLIPRAAFNNTLDGLGEEFRELTKIVAVFSEIATGSVEPLEVRQISTTNPLVYVAMATPVALAFSKVVDWLLETMRKIIDLKKAYDQSKQLGMPDAVLEPMKAHIQETVKAAIAAHSQAVVSTAKTEDEGRRNELENHLRWAMTALFAKIEQGMTVDIRLGPPPLPAAGSTEDASQHGDEFAVLSETARRLVFPKLTGEPLIPLASPPDDDEPDSSDGS